MLVHLAIRDLVIVRELALELAPGMTALTGETGAGKSILVDALGLTLGDKASPSLIRAGCERAEVASEFDLADCPAAARWLEAHDLDEDGQCQLRRVLVREGRSRAYVNGRPVTLSQLRELGELLLEIHGQHAHQSLMRPAAQRDLLDAYAGADAERAAVAEAHQALQSARAELEALREAAADRHNRLDYLRFQVEELTPVAPLAAELEELEAEHGRLAHAERLQRETAELAAALVDGEEDIGSRLGRLQRQLAELAELDPRLAPLGELLESAAIQVEEAGQTLRHYHDDLAIDPARLQTLDEQLGRLHELARKHRVETAELPALLERFQEELARLERADENLAALETRIGELESAYREAAAALSRRRREAAERLSQTVSERMQTLSMEGGRFAVQCEPDPELAGRHGSDRIAFQVAANPGQPLAPLAEAASGGELSRIALAIQVATADCGDIPTLIFDEVDVGIGGAVAEIVGRLLRRLGERRQVLCVTHLPQVAAQAHRHLQVRKHRDADRTETAIAPLDAEQRVQEIARMLGGVKITEQTLAHAREMMQPAAE
ncbi:MAG TPA: DNA repair protein RecN [Gammaproteobacteria bacterium]|nr:DNA repair protein RecN [Gammaproteobacteria bacterium]